MGLVVKQFVDGLQTSLERTDDIPGTIQLLNETLRRETLKTLLTLENGIGLLYKFSADKGNNVYIFGLEGNQESKYLIYAPSLKNPVIHAKVIRIMGGLGSLRIEDAEGRILDLRIDPNQSIPKNCPDLLQ